MNWFSYANQNPLRYTDPTGLGAEQLAQGVAQAGATIFEVVKGNAGKITGGGLTLTAIGFSVLTTGLIGGGVVSLYLMFDHVYSNRNSPDEMLEIMLPPNYKVDAGGNIIAPDGSKVASPQDAWDKDNSGGDATLDAVLSEAEDTNTTKKKAPPANNGIGPQHDGNNHNQEIDNRAEEFQENGYLDIRKNQTQVDVNGDKVGNNRPDLQGTNPETGQREYIEWDHNSRSSTRHRERIGRNDPDGYIETILLE